MDDNMNNGMSFPNELFDKMRAKILLFSPLSILM